jgi:hypothetical protein
MAKQKGRGDMTEDIKEPADLTQGDGTLKVTLVGHPWRRFFARMLDHMLYGVAWSALLALCFHINLSSRRGILDLLDTAIAALMMLILEPVLLRLFGTTLGKWIFGLRLKDENGNRPSYIAGFIRTLQVICSGLGFHIPIYNLVRLWKSFKQCSGNEELTWDGELIYTIRDTKWYRGAAIAGAYAALLGVLALVTLAAQLPPNRGKMTIAGFAENYNMLAAYYELEGDHYLTPEGKWADKQTDDSVRRIDIMHTPRPDYVFTVENGYLTGIRYEINIDGGDELLGFGEREMLLTALAFACAEDSIFSSSRNDIAKAISGSNLRDFSVKTDNVEIVCQVSYSGYISSESLGVLMPEEGVEKHFHMLFSINKISG